MNESPKTGKNINTSNVSPKIQQDSEEKNVQNYKYSHPPKKKIPPPKKNPKKQTTPNKKKTIPQILSKCLIFLKTKEY